MKRLLFLSALVVFSLTSKTQNLSTRVDKAVQTVYAQYKLFFDSNLLSKHVVLDKTKSYLVNSQTQKIKTLAIANDSFVFDEFSLSFAIVYKGDTIRHLPACRLDTHENLMALGTPSNPVQHGDLLPAYLQLAKGKIKFDYKKLHAVLQKMKVEATAIDLKKYTLNAESNTQQAYIWAVTTACPDMKCKVLEVSARNGKILAEKNP